MANNKQFIKWVTRPGSVTRDEPLLSWMVDSGVGKMFSNPTGDGNLEYYADTVAYNEFIKKVAVDVVVQTEKHLADYSVLRKSMVDSAKRVNSLVQGDKKELLNAYKKYFEATQNFCIYLKAPYALKDIIEPELSKILGSDFEKVTALGKPTVFHHFQEALLSKSPEELETEFGWINVYSIKNKPYTLAEITEIKNKANKEEILATQKQIENNEKVFNEFFSTITDQDLRHNILLSHEYAFLRTDRIDAWKEAMASLATFMDLLATMIGDGCVLEDAGELYYGEIVELLENGTKPDVQELKLRSAHKGIFVYDVNKTGVFVSDQAEKQTLLSQIKSEEGQKEIKGVVASKGKATGIVSIILNDGDFKNFKEGNVLVAVWTEPKFTSYMKLASAIVTDEGGLTSHAAIVSRELGIPCVIGTKNATKSLKNGDMVEVDAEKGIVKIIS